MAKQRASIRGRGAEILFGGPEEVEIQPREPAEAAAGPSPPESPESSPEAAQETAPDVVEEAEGEPSLDEAEMLAALEQEANDGAPLPEGEEAPPGPLDEPVPVTPEMEQAFIKEAYAAEAPPDPVAETPAPTMEVTMQEQDQDQEQALFESPPPEVEDVSSGVLPPRPSPTFMDLHFEPAEAETRDIQEKEHAVKPLELPDRELTEEERAAILAWYTDEKSQELEDEIVKTYDQIRRKVAENESVTNQAYNNLLKARDILLRREAAKIPQAEYYIEQTQALLKRVEVSESAAAKYQWGILAWGIFWAVAYLAILILLGHQWFADLIAPTAPNANNLIDTEVFVSAMVWGGIGGAVAILYSLFKHVGDRDFDPQYNISYVGKPFLGVIIGATAYMVLNLMIRVLGIFPAGLEGVAGATSPTVAPGVIYLLAWAAGFKENRILDLVDRLMKQIFSPEEKEATPEPTPTPPAA
jgi:hypothetical protein